MPSATIEATAMVVRVTSFHLSQPPRMTHMTKPPRKKEMPRLGARTRPRPMPIEWGSQRCSGLMVSMRV